MGRRKERRIAAIASGRRVKLDLFAEPSGDLGSSSTQDEVGGDEDAKNHTGLPSSPSSSGKQPENPLVLLGQYSDDELDDGSSGEQNQATAEDSLGHSDDNQEKVAARHGSEDLVNEEQNGASVERAEQIQTEDEASLLDSAEKSEACGGAGILAIGADVALDENFLTGKTAAASTSDLQVEDVTSGWKIVWHEESNQYYYWNIATGETSWAVPDVSLQGDGSDTANNGDKEKANDAPNATYPNFEMTEGSDHKIMAETSTEDALDGKRMDPDASQNHLEIPSSSAMVQNFVTSSGDYVLSGRSNDMLLRDENAKNSDSLKLGNGESFETGNPSYRVMEHCELLLEQLNNVKGSKDHLHGQFRMRSFLLEVEMRLADMKSLACHGSSLLPFWELSDKRLQQLEANINDFFQELKAEKLNEVASTDLSPESSRPEVDANSCEKKAVSASDDFFASEAAGKAELQDHLKTHNHQTTGDEIVPLERCLTGYCANASGVTEEDMDVDMEVEDAAPSSNLGFSVTSEQLGLPILTSADPGNSAPGEVYGVPPPPDEDWIPPPPPDDEPFPPPPPDEPPEISYSQPSDLVSIPSFPYVEQYNVYPSSHFQYVAQTSADVATKDVYAQTEGCQPAVSQQPLYFGTLPDTYGTATLAVNPVETGLYYGLQDAVPQTLVQAPISDSLESLNTLGDLASASLPKGEVEASVAGGNFIKANLEPSSSQAPFQSSATSSVAESVSVSSIPTSSATLSTAITASKAKVPRNKKRTVAVVSSLRSNKKVSSLVDKWKAAKEELQEQEKEPENALEILERKRQREIEEWRKQQITSGEAKDNANFQPLGGDWRERVKRKRAQLAKESVQSPSDGGLEVNPQPDLDELSRGLPLGWQAFWDDSSKKVYYGNTSTSETSWSRPTD